jgi:hypothetical protein
LIDVAEGFVGSNNGSIIRMEIGKGKICAFCAKRKLKG